MSEQVAISVEEFNRRYGRDSKGLGGAVFDGDPHHPKHSHMVGKVGTWLNEQRGVLVWATGTGRWTGTTTKGTPGIPDLVGWRTRMMALALYEDGKFAGVSRPLRPVPVLLAVECKVLPDKLNDAQKAFRKEAEAAGVLYFLATWDGESDDPAADLKAQWKGADQ